MKIQTADPGILVLLDRGDTLPDALADAVRQAGISCAWIRGIGALSDVELGYFDIGTRQYQRRTFEGSFELVSLQGDLAWSDNAPILHLHAAIAGPDLQLMGGHLFGATVSVTGEVLILPLDARIERTADAWSGLKLWSL